MRLPASVSQCTRAFAIAQARAHRLTAAYAKLPAQNSAPLRFDLTTSHQAHTLCEITKSKYFSKKNIRAFHFFMTLILLILFELIIILAGFFLQAYVLHYATKVLHVSGVLYKTAIKINLLESLLSIAVGIISLIIVHIIGLDWLLNILMIFFSFWVFHKLLQKFYQTTLNKNIKIYLIYIILTIILYVAGTIFIAIPIRYFIFEPFYTKGAAMEPTFKENEYILINKISYRFNNPKRGEIIVFRYPKNPQKYFIKRIIGLPGEKIQFLDGSVIIYNDQYPEGMKLSEPYLFLNMKTWGISDEPIEVKQNEYYVIGDNRNTSKDSRNFGPVNKNLIIGKYWITPLKK